jgi:hypothetical protein
MKIEYYHASKFGDGARVASEFRTQLAGRGVTVNVHHIREANPTRLPPADVYLFSSPGRFGRPIGSMRLFLKKVELPAGSKYAILTTELAPRPSKSGRPPSTDKVANRQRVRPMMNEILGSKGLANIGEDTVYVTAMRGPLEDGWQHKLEAFAARIAAGLNLAAEPQSESFTTP